MIEHKKWGSNWKWSVCTNIIGDNLHNFGIGKYVRWRNKITIDLQREGQALNLAFCSG